MDLFDYNNYILRFDEINTVPVCRSCRDALRKAVLIITRQLREAERTVTAAIVALEKKRKALMKDTSYSTWLKSALKDMAFFAKHLHALMRFCKETKRDYERLETKAIIRAHASQGFNRQSFVKAIRKDCARDFEIFLSREYTRLALKIEKGIQVHYFRAICKSQRSGANFDQFVKNVYDFLKDYNELQCAMAHHTVAYDSAFILQMISECMLSGKVASFR